MNKICIISCGKKKIWDEESIENPIKAEDAYIGPYFVKLKTYANHFFKDWYILSAKYGIIRKDFLIPHRYNASFTKNNSSCISPDEIGKRLGLEFNDVDEIILLAGENYKKIIYEVFKGFKITIKCPLSHYKGIGYQLRALKDAVILDKELNS